MDGVIIVLEIWVPKLADVQGDGYDDALLWYCPVRVLAPVDPFDNLAVVPKMCVDTLHVGRRAQQRSGSKVIVREVVDEERCLAEVVLDAVDVVLCALVTMSLPWQNELQVPSVVCVMPPPAS